MKRKLVIEITTDESAERANIDELMNNIKDCCHEAASELIAMDSVEHGYYYSIATPEEQNNVHIRSHWEND